MQMSKEGCKFSFVLLILCLLINVRCNRQERIRTDQVKCIRFCAMAKGIDFCYAQDWKDVLGQGRDTIIVDRTFITAFVGYLNHLRRETNDYVNDKRSVAVLRMQCGDSIVVAFGERYGIHINGEPMQNDPDLITFIDQYVYGPHEQDEDYWWPDEIRLLNKIIRKYHEQLELDNRPHP